jgi:hydroxymethylpyrimidine pyrophosphatase-like HAD family hydrolase
MTSPLPSLHDDPRVPGALAAARIMYSDLDSTLLGRGGSLLNDHHGVPTLVMAEAVVSLNRAELPVVVCSGRNAIQLTEITRMLDWSGFLAELGAVIVRERRGEKLYNIGVWPLDSVPAGKTPYQVIEESGAMARLAEAFPGLIEYHDPWHRNREATHVLRGNIDVAAAQRVVDEGDHPPIDIIDNGVIHPWRHTLVGVETIHIYHLLPRGVDKAQAVRADLERRGLAPEQALAVGDSLADLKMAEAVGLMALVANGLDSPPAVAEALRLGNVVVTTQRQGHGWSELARLWLEARA